MDNKEMQELKREIKEELKYEQKEKAKDIATKIICIAFVCIIAFFSIAGLFKFVDVFFLK